MVELDPVAAVFHAAIGNAGNGLGVFVIGTQGQGGNAGRNGERRGRFGIRGERG